MWVRCRPSGRCSECRSRADSFPNGDCRVSESWAATELNPKTYAWSMVTSADRRDAAKWQNRRCKSKLCSVRIVDEFVLCKLTQTFFRISEASIADRLKHVRISQLPWRPVV